MLKLDVNGTSQSYDGDPAMPLLWFLRDLANLTGTKYGCGMALCGACTVHLDGQAIRSCVTPVAAAAGKKAGAKVPKGKDCQIDLHATFADGAKTDATGVDVCKLKTLNLTD